MHVVDQIASLEWINYKATQAIAEVTEGLDVLLRDDVVITSSQVFPTPDTNHACLLRTSEQAAHELIDEVIDHFSSRDLSATIFTSPACTPPDLPERLLKKGFARKDEVEAWLILSNVLTFKTPELNPRIAVKKVTSIDVNTFANTFMNTFGMPPDYAPYMAQLLAPSLSVSGVYHYLALVEEEPVATCSLFCRDSFGIIGSVGVTPAYRGSPVISNLAIAAIRSARQHRVNTLVLQTTAGARFERFLRISGFERAFTRHCYVLPSS